MERRRRSIRLPDYDYGEVGAYFVTICTQGRALFLDDPLVRAAAERCWLELPDHFPKVELDAWVIMPNHLHGILVIDDDTSESGGRGVQLNAPTSGRSLDNSHSRMSPVLGSLGVIIRTYKGVVTRKCRKAGLDYFGWQRNYYEHIVRNEQERDRIHEYIQNNPFNWDQDEYNPAIGTSAADARRRA